MRFSSVRVPMWQAQTTDFERGRRRKEEPPAGSCLGHTVKSCMTVIKIDGALSGNLKSKLILRGQLSFYANEEDVVF